jgi:single-strand DNA-binding protein
LTKKPELRSTGSGTMVCNFSLAVDKGTKDEEGKKEANFFDCVCFNKNAENLVKYQDKGNMISIVGELDTYKYTDESNKNHIKTNVKVQTIEYLSKPQSTDNGVKTGQKQSLENNPFEEMGNKVASDSELPF